MSFLFCPFYKLLMNKDIKSSIMTRINDIKSCSMWLNFDLPIKIEQLDLTAINYNAILQEMNIWEDVAKLSVDLFMDYDYYKKFTFENRYDSKDYRERLESLSCVFKDGFWKCVNKPNENIVQLNVFMFCLYRLMANGISSDKTVNVSNICIFCDSAIAHFDNACNKCGATLDEICQQSMLMEKRSKDESENTKVIIGEKINETDIPLTPVLTLVTYNDDSQKRKVNDSSGVINKQEPVETLEKSVNNWKCGQCEFLNEYHHVRCEAGDGLLKNGKWSCPRCIFINSCGNNSCEICETMNTKLNIVANDRTSGAVNNELSSDICVSVMDVREKQRHKGTIDQINQWLCKKCELINYGHNINCSTCNASRINHGRWICDQCTFQNSCMEMVCIVCDSPSSYFAVKYCNSCKNKMAPSNKNLCDDCDKNRPIKWQCEYAKCNKYNVGNDQYCRVCRLIRDFPRGRGDSVKLWRENKETIVWICHRCNKINEVFEFACRECRESRYKKKYCKKCEQYNDGSTDNCDKCYHKL